MNDNMNDKCTVLLIKLLIKCTYIKKYKHITLLLTNNKKL